MKDTNNTKENIVINRQSILNTDENKIFVYALYNVVIEESELLCTVPTEEFEYILEDNTKADANYINNVLEGLTKKIVNYKQCIENQCISVGCHTLIAGYSYNEFEDIFVINLSKSTYKAFQEYLYEYSPLELEVFLLLKNSYSRKFYNRLRTNENEEYLIYKIEDFLREFNSKNKFKNFKELKKGMIYPLMRELNETGRYNIKVRENVISKKIDSITFKIEYLETSDYKQRNYNRSVIENFSRSSNHDFVDSFNDNFDDSIGDNADDNIDDGMDNEFDEYLDDVKVKDVYVPDKSIFTKGTYKIFIKDFGNTDFSDKYMEKAFDEALMFTLEKHDTEMVRACIYEDFKLTLKSKIIKYIFEEQKNNSGNNNNKDEDKEYIWV